MIGGKPQAPVGSEERSSSEKNISALLGHSMQREDNVGCFIYSSAAGGSRHKENHSPYGITDTDHRLYEVLSLF